MPNSKPQIDFATLHFPSDNLSFKTLRSKFPDLIDAADGEVVFPLGKGKNAVYHAENLTSLLAGEREIALLAFNKALGREWSHRFLTEVEIKRYLTEEYIRYGVASGKHHAKQLIRSIEESASAQGRSHFKAGH